MIYGILGGGQLGMMLIRYGFEKHPHFGALKISVLDPKGADCSVARCFEGYNNIQIIQGDLQSAEDVIQFGMKCDVLTWEIEHINIDALIYLEEEKQKRFIPRVSVLKTIQDKGLQKRFFLDHGIPTAAFVLSDKGDTSGWMTDFGEKVVLKHRKHGYDGRGVEIVSLQESRHRITCSTVIEKYIGEKTEVSVIIGKSLEGKQGN